MGGDVVTATVLAALALLACAASLLLARASHVRYRHLLAAKSADCGGPFVCPFPPPMGQRRGTRWTCPSCRTRYVLTRPQRLSGHGYWNLAWPTWRELLTRGTAR